MNDIRQNSLFSIPELSVPVQETVPAKLSSPAQKNADIPFAKLAKPNGLDLNSGAIFEEINNAKSQDLKKLHTQGHWVRDMRAVSYLYQWIDRAGAWMPASALGVAALVIGAATMTTTAIAATAGVAAVVIPLVGILVTAKAWSERESNKNQVEGELTNEFRSQRSALLTATPEKNGAGKTNEFSRNSAAMNTRVYKAIQAQASIVLQNDKHAPISEPEMDIAREILLGSKLKPVMTPTQGILFREQMPRFIIALRQAEQELKASRSDNDNRDFDGSAQIKKSLLAKGFSRIPLERYSERMKYLDSVSILEPIELNQEQYNDYLAGKPIPSRQVSYAEIDKIMSIKKIKHHDKDGVVQTKYRLYAAVKMQLRKQDKSILSDQAPTLSDDKKILFTNQVKRAMIARAETTWAGHGTDSVVGIFRALGNKESVLYKPGLLEGLLDGNEYLKSWGCPYQKIEGSSEHYTQIPNTHEASKNLYYLDLMSRASSNEYDFLLLERTGSRDPFSTGGQRPHFIKEAQFFSQNTRKQAEARAEIDPQKNPPHADGVNLPFLDKLNFSSTHCAPMHSHKYFLKLHSLDMIDYHGINAKDHSISTPLSRKAMINIFENKNFQRKQYYSEHGLCKSDISKRRPSFGPIEDNNSKSITTSIKRFNSSRDLLISLACLFKHDSEGSELAQAPIDIPLKTGHPSWNSDHTVRDMTHAMNVQTLHTEIRRLEASMHDLSCVIAEYESHSAQSNHNDKTLATETTSRNSQNRSLKQLAYLDNVIFQKKIKVLTSEVADQINNLFKTNLDYQIAYAHKNEGYNPLFTPLQMQEIKGIDSALKSLTQSESLRLVFERSHATIAHTRNRFGGGGLLNGFRGRARLPFAKHWTFQSTLNRLLTPKRAEGAKVLTQALDQVTKHRFALENALAAHKTTLKNMAYLEGLVL